MDLGLSEFESFSQPVRIPTRPGELVGGLVRLKHELLDERLDAEEFIAMLRQRQDGMLEILFHLEQELRFPPSDLSEAAESQVAGRLRGAETLYAAGLESMARYADDGQPEHLERGILLAARAESEVLELVALCEDDNRHPISVLLRQGPGWRRRAQADPHELERVVTRTAEHFAAALDRLDEAVEAWRQERAPEARQALQQARAVAAGGWREVEGAC